MNASEMIEAAIKHEEWCRDTARPEDRKFWDNWSPEVVRTGTVVATVTTSARGNGYQVVVTTRLVVQVGGVSVAYVPDTEATERVDSRVIRRAGGLEAYGLKRVAKLHGDDLQVKATHHV